MILTSTSDIIRIVTSSTADVHIQAGWADMTTSAFTPGRTNTVTTTATTTTIVASPGASTQRQVKTLRIYNAHASTSNTVTVQHYDGTTSNTVFSHVLLASESITYDGNSWSVFSATGIVYTTTKASLTADVTGVLPVANGGTNASSASITAFNNITGYTAAGSTGTTSTNLVFSTSPTLITPILGTPTSGTLTNCTGLPVAGGGTGIATTTAYSVICAGTTATGAFQSLAALGGAGSRLTSAGAGALPTFKGGNTCFHARRITAQTITTSTYTKLQLATEDYDSGSYYDNATNYRYTPLVAGRYYVGCAVLWNTPTLADQTLIIYKNGALSSSNSDYAKTTYNQQFLFDFFDMNGTTDYLEIYVWHNKGTNLDILADATSNYFCGVLVEPT